MKSLVDIAKEKRNGSTVLENRKYIPMSETIDSMGGEMTVTITDFDYIEAFQNYVFTTEEYPNGYFSATVALCEIFQHYVDEFNGSFEDAREGYKTEVPACVKLSRETTKSGRNYISVEVVE